MGGETATTPNAFIQKKVNHIFHYTKSLQSLTGILKNGFVPSYCLERINKELAYYIPMVSFCNIPLSDVGDYIFYGRYGIGLSLDWAMTNRISPVAYVHENTPFATLHRDLNYKYLMHILLARFDHYMSSESPYENWERDFEKNKDLLMEINRITVPTLQFFKNWKTEYQGQEIITYLEREWRFVPEVADGERIVLATDEKSVDAIHKRDKPHFPDHALYIKDLTQLRYVIMDSPAEREQIFDVLTKTFGESVVIEAIVDGRLFLLTWEQIRNDF
jgi:hypothetical protein